MLKVWTGQRGEQLCVETGKGWGSDEQEKEALGKRQCSLEGVGKVSLQGCLARMYTWEKSIYYKGRDNMTKWTVTKV